VKKANKKPTRAKREATSAPQTYRCTCGNVAFSKYAHKEHKGVCNG
jgi:hypothetical protein